MKHLKRVKHLKHREHREHHLAMSLAVTDCIICEKKLRVCVIVAFSFLIEKFITNITVLEWNLQSQ